MNESRSWAPAVIGLALLMLPAVSQASSAAAFRIQEDAETLGDLKPLMVEASREAPPRISLRDALDRHLSVFQEVSDARVRVQLVERVHHLQARFGHEVVLSEAEELRLYTDVLPDYRLLIREGGYHADEDSLLYQAARAAALAGETEQSVNHLQALAEEHEGSPLAPEANFRIGEHHFSDEAYALAERAYDQVLRLGEGSHFAAKALYMRGWSEFLQDRHQDAGDTFIAVLDDHHDPVSGFDHLSVGAREQVEDTVRIISIISAYSGGARALNELLGRHPDRGYTPLLYERLTVFYRDKARFRDSVAAAESFTEHYPQHVQAPALAAAAIQSWSAGRYGERERNAKAHFVETYAHDDWLPRLAPEQRRQLLSHAESLGRWHYRQGQGKESPEDQRDHYLKGADYLEQWLDLAQRSDYPASGQSPETHPGRIHLLAGDAAQQAGAFDRASSHYAEAAYESPGFDDADEAGYALVQLKRDQWQASSDTEVLDALVAASRRFIERFPQASATAGIRQDLANTLYQQDRLEAAGEVARDLVAMESAEGEPRRAGWLTLGHVALEQEAFTEAEQAYEQALGLLPDEDEREPELRGRLGVAVYRQGEAAAAEGRVDEAVGHFERVGELASGQDAAARAAFDRGAILLEAGRWSAAITALSGFTQAHAGHDLSQRIPDMLVHAHRESGDQAAAAEQLLAHEPQELSRSERWQRRLRAAGYYREAGETGEAIALYEAYITDGVDHFGDHEFQQERRRDLATLHSELGHAEPAGSWHQRLLEAEESTAGTPRSQHLASQSALHLAREATEEVDAIRLEAPLNASLADKRKALESAMGYLRDAEAYGFADTVTESTWRMGELYRGLAQDVLASERPAGLTKLQAEQYELLLEEQAYPFEEEAIALHQRNQRRISEGHWTPWVARSLEALAEIYPARYERDTRWMEARYD